MKEKMKISWIAPVLMAFFVMSIIDLVGISVDRVKEDMQLSNTLAQLIPSVTFLWFFLLSVLLACWFYLFGVSVYSLKK